MMYFPDVDAVLEEVGEGAVGEGNAALVFDGLDLAAFGDDFPAVEFGHQFAEGFELKIEAEDGANGLSLGFVDDELLVPSFVAEGDRDTGPLALVPASRDL